MAKQFDLTAKKKTQEITMLQKKLTLDDFRTNLHAALIDKIKELYGKDKWKYSFEKFCLEHHNFVIKPNQLKSFEEGKATMDNVVCAFFMEFLRLENDVTIKIDKNGIIKI